MKRYHAVAVFVLVVICGAACPDLFSQSITHGRLCSYRGKNISISLRETNRGWDSCCSWTSKITAIGTRNNVSIPKESTLINCKGMVLTAAFWNCHVHFIEPKWQHAASLPADTLTRQMQAMITRYGFAHIFDLATLDLSNLLALRQRGRIRAKYWKFADIFITGVPFTPPNGSPFYIEPLKLPEIGSPAEAAEYVKKQIDSGADAIKFWSASPAHHTVVEMPVATATAAVKAAHQEGKLVFTHPTSLGGINIAIESGVDIIAHVAPDGMQSFDSVTIARMLAKNISLIPTLKLFKWELGRQGINSENHPLVRTGQLQLSQFSKAGGRILFGTDVGYVTDYSTEDEFVLMDSAGLSFVQILASLTTAPSERFGLSKITGRLAVGMDADLVLLDGDPQKDIRFFSKVAYTFYKGKIIYKK